MTLQSSKQQPEKELGDRSDVATNSTESGLDSEGSDDKSTSDRPKPLKARKGQETQKIAGSRRSTAKGKNATDDSNRGKGGKGQEQSSKSRRSASKASQVSTKTETILDPVNQRSKFNKHLQKDHTYQKLYKKCLTDWERWKYCKRPEDDQDTTVVDDAVDIEVRDRGSEGHAVWDKQWMESDKTTTGFHIDYVVATCKRELGEELATHLLIKWSKYPMPSWEENAKLEGGPQARATADCRIRCYFLDFIEIRLRIQHGVKKFLKLFPNRYLKKEEGLGNGGYVKNRRSRYINLLRSIEWRWNYVCERAGLPPIYIEDWTNEPEDDALSLLTFINYLMNDQSVKDMLSGMVNQLEKMTCDRHCKTCTREKRSAEAKHCCGMSISVQVDQKTGEFDFLDSGKASKLPCGMNFECTDACGCDKAKCRNRTVQNGRQVPLCIFREKGKGWGVRIMQELDDHKFVSEYIGEVNQTGLPGDLKIYDFPMAQKRATKKELTISAGEKGNEARFFNHSCDPNMETRTTVVERYGIYYNHFAFYTKRKVLPGEELTFDYFPDQTAESARIDMFDRCRCQSLKCRFPEGSIPVRQELGDEEEEEEDEEEENQMNSDDSDQEQEDDGTEEDMMGDGEMDSDEEREGGKETSTDSSDEEPKKKEKVAKRRRSGKVSPANQPKKSKPNSSTESDDEEDKKEEKRRPGQKPTAHKGVTKVEQREGEGGLAPKDEEDRDTVPLLPPSTATSSDSDAASLPAAGSASTSRPSTSGAETESATSSEQKRGGDAN